MAWSFSSPLVTVTHVLPVFYPLAKDGAVFVGFGFFTKRGILGGSLDIVDAPHMLVFHHKHNATDQCLFCLRQYRC